MKVNVKCLGDLAKKGKCKHNETTPVELSAGEKVSKIMDELGIKNEETKIVFVNHRISESDRSLKDGDRVTLVPPTGGM